MSDIVAQDVELAKIAERIRTRMKRTAEDIVEIGRDLIVAKERIGHGGFGDWLQSEFEMVEMTAQRFMQVAERFGDKNNNLLDLKPSILYLLAAPSTPDAVVEKVASGEIPANTAAVKAEIAKAKADAEAAKKKADGLQKQLDMLIDAQQEVTDEHDQELQAAQEREKALRKTIDAMRSEMGKAQEKIIEKPDPKQAKKIAELEAKIAKVEQERETAKKRTQELMAQAEADAPEKQIRQTIDRNASNAANLLRQVFGLLPESRDTYAMSDSEWRAMDLIEHMAQQVIDHLHTIRTSPTIIDAR